MVVLKVLLHKSPATYQARAPRGGPNIKAACNKTYMCRLNKVPKLRRFFPMKAGR